MRNSRFRLKETINHTISYDSYNDNHQTQFNNLVSNLKVPHNDEPKI